MKKHIIVVVNYGIASNYGDYIEINKKLDKYPKLKNKILKHEKRHKTGKYTWTDFSNDFQSKDSYFLSSLWFAIKNPESLINYFPMMYSYYFQKWTYNLSSIYPFLYFGLLWTLLFTLLFHVNLFLAILGYIIVFSIVNITLLIYTHLFVLFKARNEF